MNAIDVLKYGHFTVIGSVDAFTEDRWNEAGVCGVWSTRQIIAHLASYELLLVDILRGTTGAGETALLEQFIAAGPEFNDSQVEKRNGRSWAQVLEEYASAYEQVAEIARRIPAETWRQPGTIPWYGAEYSLDDLIAYQYYGHKREHCAQIDVFRDRMARCVTGNRVAAATP